MSEYIEYADIEPADEWEDEPLTPEEQAAEYRAYIRQSEAEAYAEFLDAPNCFD